MRAPTLDGGLPATAKHITDEAVPIRGLRSLTVAVGLGMFATGVNGALLYRLIDQQLDRGPAFIGLTSVASGVGAAVMGLFSGRLFLSLRAGRTAALGLALSAAGYGLLAVGAVGGALAGALLGGAGLPLALVALITYVQHHAHPDHLGATVATASAKASLPLPVGTLFGAAVVAYVPAPLGYCITATLAATGAFIAISLVAPADPPIHG